ncbi:MAG: DUF1211 domain-containing protein [Chlorobiaceae bacterium]|jgi:uncharacterized membrane protein|nr:DUF1211 domain-containing protein [Chlorobiaceae bacterium]
MYEVNETVRIESFSDAVFAIAITLLVIEIKVPGHEQVAKTGLLYSLIDIWPSYLAFVTSFATVLVIWVHHQRIFAILNKYDHKLFYYNGLLLFFVTFIPFPTALLAEYLLYRESKVAAIFYTGIFLAISLSFDLLWRHVSKQLLSKNAIMLKKDEALEITKQYKFGPPLYLLAFGMSFVSEPLSITICLLLALFFALRGWPFKEPL